MNNISLHIFLFLKGIAMGAANVIPGVSGGTIAFITGIYDDLIKSLKSFDLKSIQLLFKGKFKEFAKHINISFLAVLFAGVFAGIISFGKLLKWIIEIENHKYEIFVWAFFFGLIIASVYSVGKTVKSWSVSTIIASIIGIAAAISLVLFNQASENEAVWYLILCGVMAMASMLLPGLSGSFVLMLMGNYYLIMLEAVSNKNISILIPVAVGAVIGFVLLSRIISFFLNKYENGTIGLLTGFVFGSLSTIWPWKDIDRNLVTKADGSTKEVIEGFSNWYFPGLETNDIICYACIIAGIILVWGVEFIGNKFSK